jgi:hypothetical protein
MLKGRRQVTVIEGDQQTSQDAERIRATGAPAIQINTGKGCHLDAHMVGHAMEKLELADDSLLMIENVGNLVCPAAFDLGEACKVVILSVTEGEDKPIKYPDMFRAASLMLMNKCDLLPAARPLTRSHWQAPYPWSWARYRRSRVGGRCFPPACSTASPAGTPSTNGQSSWAACSTCADTPRHWPHNWRFRAPGRPNPAG